MAGLFSSGPGQRLYADAVAQTTVTAATKPRSVQVFTAMGAGDKDGSDWSNAMPIAALGRALSRARPGSGYLIGFDPAGGGSVQLDRGQVVIKVSGEEERPVFLQAGLPSGAREIAAAKADAPLFKSAKPWSVKEFGGRGSSFFAFSNGASHLRLAGFHVDGTPADGFFKFRAKQATTYSDIVFSGIEARNVGRVIETERGCMLRDLLVSDCRAIGIVRGFARFRDLSDSTFRDLELDAANMDGGGKNVCQLIAVTAGENLLFENINLRNAKNEPAPKEGKQPGYVQGDGIVCERKTRNIVIRNCHASNMGDGGFDLKTTGVTMEDCTTDSCKFGARIWVAGNNIIRRCDFRNPVSRNETMGACVQVGGTLEIIDTKMQAGPGTVAVSLSYRKDRKPPLVVMRGGSIETQGDGAVAHCNGDGVLEVYDVAINGVPTTHRYVFEKKDK